MARVEGVTRTFRVLRVEYVTGSQVTRMALLIDFKFHFTASARTVY